MRASIARRERRMPCGADRSDAARRASACRARGRAAAESARPIERRSIERREKGQHADRDWRRRVGRRDGRAARARRASAVDESRRASPGSGQGVCTICTPCARAIAETAMFRRTRPIRRARRWKGQGSARRESRGPSGDCRRLCRLTDVSRQNVAPRCESASSQNSATSGCRSRAACTMPRWTPWPRPCTIRSSRRPASCAARTYSSTTDGISRGQRRRADRARLDGDSIVGGSVRVMAHALRKSATTVRGDAAARGERAGDASCAAAGRRRPGRRGSGWSRPRRRCPGCGNRRR